MVNSLCILLHNHWNCVFTNVKSLCIVFIIFPSQFLSFFVAAFVTEVVGLQYPLQGSLSTPPSAAFVVPVDALTNYDCVNTHFQKFSSNPFTFNPTKYACMSCAHISIQANVFLF